ncbi:MAG: hypothetical protein OXB88_09455 [Bacteriovoracales bacterium]|nr:hypothetical protein [Bacteriovoracales bacterium]
MPLLQFLLEVRAVTGFLSHKRAFPLLLALLSLGSLSHQERMHRELEELGRYLYRPTPVEVLPRKTASSRGGEDEGKKKEKEKGKEKQGQAFFEEGIKDLFNEIGRKRLDQSLLEQQELTPMTAK